MKFIHIVITLAVVIALTVIFLSYTNKKTETKINSTSTTSVEGVSLLSEDVYTSKEIGITFTYTREFGEPVFLDYSKPCPEINETDNQTCKNFQILFGGDTLNSADVAVFALNRSGLELIELGRIGKEGISFPWPPVNPIYKNDECFVPGVPSHSNGKCEYVSQNNILMRHTYLDIQNAINDFPRYEYSFYVPNKNLGVVIYTKKHDSEKNIDFIEKIIGSLELI